MDFIYCISLRIFFVFCFVSQADENPKEHMEGSRSERGTYNCYPTEYYKI